MQFVYIWIPPQYTNNVHPGFSCLWRGVDGSMAIEKTFCANKASCTLWEGRHLQLFSDQSEHSTEMTL